MVFSRFVYPDSGELYRMDGLDKRRLNRESIISIHSLEKPVTMGLFRQRASEAEQTPWIDYRGKQI